MKGKVLNLNGEVVKEIDLPPHFEEQIRKDVIKRAFWATFSHLLQPYGVDPMAGKRRVVFWHHRRRKRYRSFYGWGVSRVPRYIIARLGGGWAPGLVIYRAGFAPHCVGGRRAHPPTADKVLYEKVNKKERRLAIRSCIAASCVRKLLEERGHIVPENLPLPTIFVNDIENIKKTKEIREVLKKVGLWEEIERVKEKTRIRAGKGKRRGRRYKEPIGPLFVVSQKDAPLCLAVRNLPGVDVVPVNELNLLLLAPGAHPGRLIIWSEAAVEKLRNLYL